MSVMSVTHISPCKEKLETTNLLDQGLPTERWKLKYAFSNLSSDMIGQTGQTIR